MKNQYWKEFLLHRNTISHLLAAQSIGNQQGARKWESSCNAAGCGTGQTELLHCIACCHRLIEAQGYRSPRATMLSMDTAPFHCKQPRGASAEVSDSSGLCTRKGGQGADGGQGTAHEDRPVKLDWGLLCREVSFCILLAVIRERHMGSCLSVIPSWLGLHCLLQHPTSGESNNSLR